MIGKKIFLEKIKMLQTLHGETLTKAQVDIYYEILSADMSDSDFIKQVGAVIRSEFRFPPIAAFYKGYEQSPSFIPDARSEHYKKVTA